MRLLLFLCITIFNLPLFASDTGKLSGVVRSGDEPLSGAHVTVEGTRLGTATDLEGRFLLLNVPAGRQVLNVSHLGYMSLRQELWSIAGESIRLDFQLEAGALKAEDVKVVAARHELPLTRTSRMVVVDGDELARMPVPDLGAMLQLKAGLSRDDSGELHLRGGRSGEISFLVDGVEVEDPYNGTFDGMLNEGAVQELVLVAGTFNAEYGDAMSGVVNIVTRRQAAKPEFRFRYRSPDLLGSPWRESSPFGGVVDELPYSEQSFTDWTDASPADARFAIPGESRLGLAAPFPGSWQVRLDLQSREEDSHLPHGYNSEGVVQLNLGREFKGGGRVDFGWERARGERLNYSHLWKYLPENQSRTRKGRSIYRLNASKVWSDVLVSQLRVSHAEHQSWTGVFDAEGNALSTDLYQRPVFRAEQDFYREGNSSNFSERSNRRLSLAADLTWQMDHVNEWKLGLEWKQDDLDNLIIHNAWGDAERFEDHMQHRPTQVALYVQDRLEFQHLVLNAGLRLDGRDPDAKWWEDPLSPFVEADGQAQRAADHEVGSQIALSPRLGLAFPFTDTAVLHAAYGHFLQFAPLYALYGNHDRNMDYSRTPLLGNPDVKPQKTVAWEIGLEHEMENGSRLSVAAWYKDLEDLLSTREVIQYTQVWVVYHNTDFANVRGLDLSWSHPLSHWVRLNLDYTWMNARGNAAQPESGLIRAESGQEASFNEFPLDYEQIHDLAARLQLKPHKDLEFQLVAEAGSGLPYTPFIDIGVEVPVNSANRPWTARLDGSLRWNNVLGFENLDLWFELRNLLDRRNVIHVYPSTGDPFDDPRGLIGSTPDALHDPSHVEAPRSLRLGVQFTL